MIIGIDAHNIRGNGGSLIHLKELLANSDPELDCFEKLVVWVNKETYSKLIKRDFIKYITLPERNHLQELYWSKFNLEKDVKKNKCSVLFVPGGIYLGNFKPFVVLAQSMLPFDKRAQKIYLRTLIYPILLLKKLLMIYTFNRANGIIFVSKAMKYRVESTLRKSFKNVKIIHQGVSEIFLPKSAKQKLNSKENKIKLLTVSSHSLHKNLILLVKQIAELRNEKYNLKLDMKIILSLKFLT